MQTRLVAMMRKHARWWVPVLVLVGAVVAVPPVGYGDVVEVRVLWP